MPLDWKLFSLSKLHEIEPSTSSIEATTDGRVDLLFTKALCSSHPQHSPKLPYSKGIGSLAAAIPVLTVMEREKLSKKKLKCTARGELARAVAFVLPQETHMSGS